MMGLAELRRVVVYAAAVGVVALVAACSGGDRRSEVPTGSPQATAGAATVDPQHLPILTAFELFVAAAGQAANEADPGHPGLADTADEQALITTQRDIQRNADDGRRYLGGIGVAAVAASDGGLLQRGQSELTTLDVVVGVADGPAVARAAAADQLAVIRTAEG